VSAAQGARDELGTRRDAWVFVLLAAIAFSTSGPFARLAAPADPLVIALGRVAVAGVVLGATDPRPLGRALRALTGKQRLGVLGAGVLLAAHFWLFLWGLVETSFPAAMSLISLEPLSVVVVSFLAFRVRPSRGEQIGVVVATAGALVVARGAGTGDHRLFGDVLVLGAVVLFGAYVAAARGLRDALAARHYAVLVYAAAALALLPAVLFAPSVGPSALSEVSLASWAWIAAIGLVPTAIGHTLVQSAARHASPALVALACPGETLGAIAIGVAVLGALPTPTELVGGAIIVAGATWAIVRGRATPRDVVAGAARGPA
jgi:drug/metabolite transporter (DMT)-like permease